MKYSEREDPDLSDGPSGMNDRDSPKSQHTNMKIFQSSVSGGKPFIKESQKYE
jgi:hypothetical protein